MRLKSLLAGLLALLPLPALADVTAHYSAGPTPVTIEVDDSGDFRVSFDARFSIICRDGVEYLVITAPGGTMVTPLADLLALGREQGKFPAPSRKTEKLPAPILSAMGEEVVGGRKGIVWKIAPPTPDAGYRASDSVMSSDPELAPLGKLFTHLVTLLFDIVAPSGSEGMRVGITQILAKGAPLRLGQRLRLGFATTDPIDPSRFELPSEPIPAADVLARMDKARRH